MNPVEARLTGCPVDPVRILFSFPHKLGADRICYTAWQQVNGLSVAGADVLVFPGALHRPVPSNAAVRSTLARGGIRIPYKLLGSRRAFALHDAIVARRLRKLAGQVDIVHTWPLGALRTLKAARDLGIPTVLERPTHTRSLRMKWCRGNVNGWASRCHLAMNMLTIRRCSV